MKSTTQILTEFLTKAGYEKVHFGTPEDISLSSIQKNADQAREFLQKRLKQTDFILFICLGALIVLFATFIWFLVTYRAQFNMTTLLLGNGISVGIFGWIILTMRKMWKEKTITELCIYTLSSSDVSVEELLKIIALIKDSQ